MASVPRRHLATVFQGLLMGRPEQINSGEKLAHMWLHESERVYGDRLVSPEDLKKYNDLAQGQARKIFSQFPVDKFYAKENADPLVFCHFCEVRDSALKFPSISQLELRVDGVSATPRHRGAIEAAA